MIKLKNSSIVIMLVIFSSCKTYDTFYGTTYSLDTFDAKSKRLDLSHQNISVIPEGLQDLNALKMLDLSGTTGIDTNIILESLPHPEKLEVLLLDSLNISTLPVTISSFKNLKQLSLAYNKNLNLEDTFTQLKDIPLEFLNLQGNAITQLPENISQLETLKDLNLSYNHLHDEASYSYLGQLPLLYSLWLDHNDFTQLPKTIGALNQITFFYVVNNQLNELPKEISSMKNLSVFHLGFNNFTELPEELITVPNLLQVHINNNQITTIPRSFGTKKHRISAIIFDNNPIPENEQKWAEKTFSSYFLLSFKQDY